ncbi:MAG: hypothetical protein OHK0040_13490 [bacterium]
MKYKSFQDMDVWQSAMDLAVKIYKTTENLPRKEDYGFTSQIRRSALSISANIAEAFGREHSLEKINFYYISRGSISETQSHLEYGRRVGYIQDEIYDELNNILTKLTFDINKLIKSIKAKK